VKAACVVVIYLHGCSTEPKSFDVRPTTVYRHSTQWRLLLLLKLPPVMQRDDSANLGDMNDNNDDNTDSADGGKCVIQYS